MFKICLTVNIIIIKFKHVNISYYVCAQITLLYGKYMCGKYSQTIQVLY